MLFAIKGLKLNIIKVNKTLEGMHINNMVIYIFLILTLLELMFSDINLTMLVSKPPFPISMNILAMANVKVKIPRPLAP